MAFYYDADDYFTNFGQSQIIAPVDEAEEYGSPVPALTYAYSVDLAYSEHGEVKQKIQTFLSDQQENLKSLEIFYRAFYPGFVIMNWELKAGNEDEFTEF